MVLLCYLLMKCAKIVHNPKAGKQEHSKKKLKSLVEASGFDCGYSSTKDIASKKMKKADFLVIAGGDGTVRKVVTSLARKKREKILPILLLPLGTANNIARSLGVEGHIEDIIKNIQKRKLKKFDIGRIHGLKKEFIFLESFGFGVFPELMHDMEEFPEREDASPEENMRTALEKLHSIVLNYPAKAFTVIIDGAPHTDDFILIEVMNINSIGPNLNISPDGDPGDGQFELILIPESQREQFARYVSYKIGGIETTFVPVVIKGRKISIATPAGLMHVDDELKKLKKSKTLTLEPESGMLEFFVQ
jgi:diacylglycerol kinase (ATP)